MRLRNKSSPTKDYLFSRIQEQGVGLLPISVHLLPQLYIIHIFISVNLYLQFVIHHLNDTQKTLQCTYMQSETI